MPFWFVLLSALLLQAQPGDLKTDCMTLEDPEAIIAACSNAIDENPETAELYLYRGDAYLLNENYVEARADYNTVISLDPENAVAYYNLGVLWALFDVQANAQIDYTTAIELDPTYVDAYLGRGISYGQDGQYEQALDDLNVARELDPNNITVRTETGLIYAIQGDYDAAMEAYNEAIELDDENGLSYAERAYGLLFLRDYPRAILDYDRALELGVPEPIDSYNGRGSAQAELGNYEAALDNYNAALEIEERLSIWVSRVDVYFALEDYETALAECQRIIELNSGYNAACYMYIARIGERIEQPDLALEAANEYVGIMQQSQLITEGELPTSQRATFPVSFEQQWSIEYPQVDPASIIATAYSQSGDIDPVLMLLDPNGEVVAFNDNALELDGRDARIVYDVPAPDTYTVILTYIGDGGVIGDVELVIE